MSFPSIHINAHIARLVTVNDLFNTFVAMRHLRLRGGEEASPRHMELMPEPRRRTGVFEELKTQGGARQVGERGLRTQRGVGHVGARRLHGGLCGTPGAKRKCWRVLSKEVA